MDFLATTILCLGIYLLCQYAETGDESYKSKRAVYGEIAGTQGESSGLSPQRKGQDQAWTVRQPAARGPPLWCDGSGGGITITHHKEPGYVPV